MARVTGGTRYVQKLGRISTNTRKRVGAVLYTAAQEIQADAQISLTTGSQSGANHQPSAPGTPPNNDSGHLANSIVARQVTDLVSEVSANARYARIQEYGGVINHPGGTPYFIGRDGMARFVGKGGIGASHNLPVTKPHIIVLPARPYMRPALEKKRQRVKDLIRIAVREVVNGT